MGVWVKDKKSGKDKYLINPSERAEKYVNEIKSGIRFTDSGELKKDKFDNSLQVTKEGRAYRSGYLAARKDSAKAYKHNKKKGRT